MIRIKGEGLKADRKIMLYDCERCRIPVNFTGRRCYNTGCDLAPG
jgi:hypothetical protein